jgi:hypothetical protein
LGEGEYILQAIALAEDHLASDVLRKVIKVQPGYSDGVKVHVMGYTHIWAWDDVPAKLHRRRLAGGGDGRPNPMDGLAIPSPMFQPSTYLFSNGGAGKTRDMVREAGEYWFFEGEWYTQDPYLPVAPQTVGISPEPGLYVESQAGEPASGKRRGMSCIYTLDGSIPDTVSTNRYSGPFYL